MNATLRTYAMLCSATLNLGGGNQPVSVLEMQERAIAFEHRHDAFVRTLFGCPSQGVMSDAVCNPRAGGVDYQQFKNARAAAAKFYDLKEN